MGWKADALVLPRAAQCSSLFNHQNYYLNTQDEKKASEFLTLVRNIFRKQCSSLSPPPRGGGGVEVGGVGTNVRLEEFSVGVCSRKASVLFPSYL